ncbi:MAG: response regulator [Lachnospiraceae bacterium]|nr:response regulator [Lachnospiraceae bacterium]
MYRVMLADDEGIVIDALNFILEKNFDGKCSIQSAKSGRDAIELAEHFRPDIVFMDIQMPGINGLKAMEEIHQENPNTVFVIVSAYDKFDYAKEAMRLGAMCYINKPLEKEEIIRTMQKAMQHVDELHEKRSRDLQVREKLEIVVPIIENGFIYSIMFQKDRLGSLTEYQGLLDLHADNGFVMVLRCGENGHHETVENPVGTGIRIQGQYPKLREIVKSYFTCMLGAMMGNVVTVYVPWDTLDPDKEYENRIQVIERARQMCRELSQKLNARFQAGIGAVKTLAEAQESYSEAARSLEYVRGAVIHVKDLPLTCNYENNYPIETEKALFDALEEGNEQQTRLKAMDFFQWMQDTYPDHPQDIKLKVLEFVLQAESMEYINGGMYYRFTSRSEYLQTIQELTDYAALQEWFLQKLLVVCRNIANKRQEAAVDTIQTAKAYIRQNFARDICLDEVSEQVQISPYYFSKLFKKETGTNFIEYLTGVRMEKAKELLKGTQMSMKEISQAAGYSNPNYFSHTFKKNVGISPSEYKEGKA